MASSTANEGASSPDSDGREVKVPAITVTHSDQNNSSSPRPQRAVGANATVSRPTTNGQKRVTIKDDERSPQDDDEDIGDDAVMVEWRTDTKNEVHGRSNSSLHPDASESGERARVRARGSWLALQSPVAHLDSSDSGNADLSFADVEQFDGLDETSIVQAVVFLEDGFHYRSILHKTDEKSLRFYRFYFSQPVQVFHIFIITLLHLLVFVEIPSSLTWTSDIRHQKERITLPCGVTESIEVGCLLLLAADTVIKGYLMGQYYFLRHRWLLASVIVLSISFIDWMVSVFLGCREFYRVRRILRPYFIIHNSSLMKKTVHCLWKIIPEALNVLLLLALILFIFTLTGMLLFPKYGGRFNDTDTSSGKTSNGSGEIDLDPSGEANYFRTLYESMMNLLILLTTANNPDVTLPAYSDNRLFSLFFIGYLILGLFCVHNMLTAVIYNGFRGYFQTSMQSSFFRRRLAVRAAFEVLRRRKRMFRQGSSIDTISPRVGAHVVKEVVSRAHLPQRVKEYLKGQLETYGSEHLQAEQFNVLFDDLRECQKRQRPRIRWYTNPHLHFLQTIFTNRIFIYSGILMAFVNVVLIAVQLATRYDETMNNSHSNLRIVNFMFVIYYIVELVLRMWSQGWNHYIWDHFNKLDVFIVILLAGGELFAAIEFGLPYFPGPHQPAPYSAIVWNVVRIINMLIMIRVFRVIHHIPAMAMVAGTLVDMVKNFKAFAGVMVGTYYSYALIGIELFHNVIEFNPNATELSVCGTYQQLNYWANNFDDFFAAVVVLWDVMVVNNWFVFLDAYAKATSKWSNLYFVVWWLICCNFVLNLLLALILEHFVTKRDKQLQQQRELRGRSQSEVGDSTGLMSVHDMFRSEVLEPAESQLLVELSNHQHLHLAS